MRSKTDCWSRLYCGIIPVALLFASHAYGVTNAVPQPFEVYGATIGTIDAIQVTGETNKTRVFASTDSANSVFYADVDHSNPTPFDTNFIFQVVPDLDANANFGAPNWIAAHQQSGRVFTGTSSGLVSCATSSGSLVTNISSAVSFVLVQGSNLFAVSQAADELAARTLYYGSLDSSGTLTLGSALSTNFYGRPVTLAVSPVDNKVYVLCTFATNCVLLKSSDDYDAFSSATTFSQIPTTAVTLQSVSQVAVGPDGRLFLGGGSTFLEMAYSDDAGGVWTNFDTGASRAGGGIGLNIVCNGSSNAYEVYFGWVVSSNKGAGTWAQLPRGGFRPNATHVNSGCVKVDPLDTNMIYVTTDKGIGGSTNAGVDVVELNNGLLAFQINDIDALSDKTVAWIGSKAGMRWATNFNTTPVWTDGEFPDAIVYACAIDSDDPSGLTGYAGSSRLYKTTTGGGSNVSSWVQVFNWTNYNLTDGEMAAVKAKGNQVVLGYYSYSQNSPSGGVFVSSNGGSNWTAAITNIDVNDIIIRDEGGAGVIYAAISKAKAGDRGGIYRAEGSSAALDLTNEVNIRKLAEDSSGGIYASGTVPDTSEPGRHRVVAYYRADNVSGWEQLTTNGLPAGLWEGYVVGRVGGPPVITVGKDSATNDVPVLAVLRTIYYLPVGGSSWVAAASYPNGTQIKALFWDELMVGTTIGLYGQGLQTAPSSSVVTGDFDRDGKADPTVVAADGVWTIWMSSADYAPVSTIPLYVAGGTPVTGDFDLDGKADPCMVDASGVWKIWMSSGDYAPVSTTPLYVAGGTPVTGDFDNDGKADPCMVDASGVWKIWMSSADYAPVSTTPLYVAGGTPVAADFDNDGKADPCMVDASGIWKIWMSSGDYAPVSTILLYVAGGTPVAGDFDLDGKADPAMVAANGVWKIWMSSADYVPVSTIPLVP